MHWNIENINIVSVFSVVIIYILSTLFHELGHFCFAKRYGVKIIEMCFGMGPRLLDKSIGGMHYCIKLLPIGASCRIKRRSIVDVTAIGEVDSLESKDTIQKSLIIYGGAIFNCIIVAICFAIFSYYDGLHALKTIDIMSVDSLNIFDGSFSYVLFEQYCSNSLNAMEIIQLIGVINLAMAFFSILPLPFSDGGKWLYFIFSDIKNTGIHNSKTN